MSVREVAPTMLLHHVVTATKRAKFLGECFLPSKLPKIQQLVGAEELHRRGTKTSKKPPASGNVVRDEQQEGMQRAASLPAQ